MEHYGLCALCVSPMGNLRTHETHTLWGWKLPTWGPRLQRGKGDECGLFTETKCSHSLGRPNNLGHMLAPPSNCHPSVPGPRHFLSCSSHTTILNHQRALLSPATTPSLALLSLSPPPPATPLPFFTCGRKQRARSAPGTSLFATICWWRPTGNNQDLEVTLAQEST